MSLVETLAIFGVSLFLFALLERVINALVCVFVGAKSDGKSLRAQLLVEGAINLISVATNTFLAVVWKCFVLIGWMMLLYLSLYCVFALIYVIYDKHPHVIHFWFEFYSRRVGPLVHGFLLMPFELFNLLFKSFIPLYNAAVWMLRSLGSKGFLPILWDNIGLCVELSVYVMETMKTLTASVLNFVSVVNCDGVSCVERKIVWDLVSPMSSVRGVALVASKLAGEVCSPVKLPVEFLLYPFTDLRFAKGLHGLVNSILQLLVLVPQTTFHRCRMSSNYSVQHRVLMCSPDLKPLFDHAVNGVKHLGSAGDNWLSVGMAMARTSLTGAREECNKRVLNPSVFRDEMLAGAQTVVGLTDWLLVSANGSAAYFYGQGSTGVTVRYWPDTVDVSFGLAAVNFDRAGDYEVSSVTHAQRPTPMQTTSVLGCKCVDTDAGLRVLCSVVSLSGGEEATDRTFYVQFQDDTWSTAMTCRAVEISVKSVRWPVRRYEGKSVPFGSGRVDLPELDCISRGSCENVDATIWLVPKCDLLRPEQCSDAAVGTSCFPFCMAVRVSGSRDASPVFVSAEAWRTGKQLLMRDCALKSEDAAASGAFVVGGGTVTTSNVGKTTFSAQSGSDNLFVSRRGDGSSCITGSNLASWVPTNVTQVNPRSVASYVRRKGQPFAIAGDTVLLEFPTTDGASKIEVDRLSGDQKDAYTLIPGWAGLLAAPKTIVPVQELSQEERSRVVIPRNWVTTRVPATASRNYVFYAVSPDLKIFQAYMDYCRGSSDLPQVQWMMLSSYSALRIYRVRAYCQENCESEVLTSQYTFRSFSDGKFTPGSFTNDCSMVYNASVDSLEYVNEQNVAVVVQVADKTYDPSLRSGSNSTFVTYWLNPQSMGVRSDTMWPTELPSTLTTSLCVDSEGVPKLASIASELVVAGIHVLHRVVGGVVYAPGLAAFWRGGALCPAQHLEHSVLAACASDVFSFDDFFDSIDAASAIFWGIPAWIAEQLEQGRMVSYSPVSDVLRGFGAYGRGTVDITQLRGGVMSLLNTPLPEQLSGVFALAKQPGAVAGAAKIMGAASSWARYSCRFFVVVSTGVVQQVLQGGALSLNGLWSKMVGTLYDERPLFKSAVTDRSRSACLGLEVMAGGANPLGRVMHHSCLSSALLLDGMMDIFLRLFVDAPVLKCVCKDSAGRKVAKYARDNCVPRAPQTMQPILFGMIAAADGLVGGDALLCPSMIAHTRSSMEQTMRPYFASVMSSLDALGDLVDYMLIGYDADAGQCKNFDSNPQVVVIMPEPVDYFQGCGMTTSCKAKCSGNWDALQAALSDSQVNNETRTGLIVKNQQIDSWFFPEVVSDIIAPGKIMAMTNPDLCGAWVCREILDECMAVAALSKQDVSVVFYCIPKSPAASVYASEVDGVNWVGHVESTFIRQVSFLNVDGSSAAVLLESSILLVQRSGVPRVVLHKDYILSLPLYGFYPMQVLDFMAIQDKLLVNLAVRSVVDGEFQRDVATIWLEPSKVQDMVQNAADQFPFVVRPALKSLWKGYTVSEYSMKGDTNQARLLFWPLVQSNGIRRVTFQWTNNTFDVVSVEPFSVSASLVARATLLPRDLILSKRLREDPDMNLFTVYSTTGAVYDWLRQLRLTGRDLNLLSAAVSNSQVVTASVTVQTSCDGLDCRGCGNSKLRSLCSAYQSCAVFRCIGTPVNLKRPLCGVGGMLKSLGNVGIESVQGAWLVFIDVYMILLQLNVVMNLPGVEVNFPDDAFMGNMCAAKDVSVELISVLTSTVNSALQKAQSILGWLDRASHLDSSVNTMLSMSTAAVTGFLNQIALAPVYILSVGHKIMMCQVSGTLAVIGKRGFEVSIQSAKFSSTDAISGQCLTKSAEVGALQTGDATEDKRNTAQNSNVLSFSAGNKAMKRLEPFMHVVDGGLTYLIGVVSKFADVLQTTDVKHCVLPDVTLHSTVRCACGDTGVSIDSVRRREGLADFAYWCTGALSLPNANNRMQYVWNPYTYEQLQNIVGDKLDQYVKAASVSSNAAMPNNEVFERQGVSMFSVLTRCRQNFVNKQWDSAAYVRYERLVLEREIKGSMNVQPGDVNDGVGQCLVDSMERGATNGACLDDFLNARGFDDSYWSYTILNDSVPSNLLDACLVFSGPASNKSVSQDRREKFQNCIGGYGLEGVCDLSGYVWSPASANAVPVAARHVIQTRNDSHLRDAVTDKMQRASEMVMARLAALSNYENKDLQSAVFSAEGDVIHQLLDCVFLGPYARMDYWPVPFCDESERPDCLVGPYWSRDDRRGKTRKLDVDTCNSESELPFTCGSPTRRAMVKDFVKQYLEIGQGGADLIQSIIREWIRNQTVLWSDVTAFYCNVSNQSNNCDGSNLPSHIRDLSLQISTREMISALRERVGVFFNASMRTAEPWISFLKSDELAKYNWTTSPGSHHVRSQASYHPAKPTQAYSTSEAFNPPTTFASHSLWHVCHSALKQVMFTLPTNDDGSLIGGVPTFSGGSVEVIAEHVKQLVQRAFQDSPLFRHYHPRHHPSPSRMCSGSPGLDARQARGSVHFSDYVVNGITVFNGSSIKPIPALAYDAAVLGSEWMGGQMGLTEHLGFLDREGNEEWLRGSVNLTTSGDFLLRHGPGGVKIGNLPHTQVADLGFEANFTADLNYILKNNLRDDERVHSPESAVLYGCDQYTTKEKSLMEDFVDGLFPMAQGVRESGVGSYCLRYAIELALLHTYELHGAVSMQDIVKQKDVVVSWRKKCGTQVQLVAMCNGLDLYRDGGFQTYTCLHPWRYVKNSSKHVYVTPDCLVRIDDFFYDPCVCKPQWCASLNATVDVDFMELPNSNCLMKFDPRNVVQSVELGWWDEDMEDEDALIWNSWLRDPVNFLKFDVFQASVLSDGQSVGNVMHHEHWSTAEGFMNETSVFCDMVSDYWPEDFEYPVGYHVTVPCDADDTGFRSFDNVFVQDEVAGVPIMRYMEDQSRNSGWIDSNFGAGGLCRGTTFGFDMYETNTMRVCTRVSSGEDVDVHVPRGIFLKNDMGTARCSDSSKDIPWGDNSFYEYYDASFNSVGTIPNLPTKTALFYPENNDKLLVIGPQHRMNIEGWGDGCQDVSIPNCSESNWRCPLGYACLSSGVCQHLSVQCTRHSDCPGEKMCTGLGQCVDPVISVENQLGNDTSFRAHTTECAGEAYSMIGASHWGYVPDFLEAHGMCSYRHWREYLYTMDNCNCTVRDDNTCVLNANTCPYYVFSNQLVNNRWWNSSDAAPTRMKMIPTTCDRDYERFKINEVEMKSCVPQESRMMLLRPDGVLLQMFTRDVLWKVYDESKKSIPLRRMPARQDVSSGFLGVSKYDKIDNCMSVRQCFVGPFTKNGKLSMLSDGVGRANRSLMDGSMYDANDQFRCGVIGFYDTTKKLCVIDEKAFPLYYIFCNSAQKSVSDICATSLKPGSIPARCDDVRREYTPQYSVIQDVNVPALNAFFNIFEQPQNLEAHLNLVNCVSSIYNKISQSPFDSKGLYYASAFSLYEIPFAWFYQCNIGSGVVVANNFEKKIYACTFYEAKNELSTYVKPQDGKYTDFSSFIFNVRGGYTWASVNNERMRQKDIILRCWNLAVEEVRSELFKASGVDLTYPRCHTEILWDLPATSDVKRKLIESFVRSRCTSNLISKYVQIMNQRYNTQYTVRNVINALTKMGANVTQQNNHITSNKLLTGLIQRYGTDVLTKAAEISLLNIQNTPISLNYDMPLTNSSVFSMIRNEWKQLMGVLPNEQDVKLKENIQECESSQLQNVYQDFSGKLLSGEDTDLASGLNSTVQTCPVYAQGQFNCSYPDLYLAGITVTLSGGTGNVDNQFDNYVNVLYSEVKKRYDRVIGDHVVNGSLRSFSMNELKFYSDEKQQFFGNFTFNLQGVADYANNINPDVRTPVMCVAGNQQVDYNKCNDPNFLALKQHVQNEYTTNGGVVVPYRSQLNWRVSKQMMTSGAIFSFASTSRDVSKQFLKRLFDSSEVCSASAANREDRMCYFDAVGALGNRTTITPWMSGGWNPFDRCDVEQMDAQNGNTEKIDSYCYYEKECPPEKGLSTSTVDYYKYMPNNNECILRNNEKTRNLNVNSKLLYNLCRHSLNEDSICRHTQGMVGGSDGYPMEDYSINGNLFTLHNFSKMPWDYTLLFGNALLRRESSEYGFLKFDTKHIGGHHLGLRISDGSMVVWRMPLKGVMDKTMMNSWDTSDVVTWVSGWLSEMTNDDQAYKQNLNNVDYVVGVDDTGQHSFAWDCPLRRRAFYTGGVKNFKPHLPSARRSRAMFGDVIGGLFAHPTQRRQSGDAHFGRYKTTNGFCFCPVAEETWPDMCGVPINVDYQHNCSLFNTLKSVQGLNWGWSHTFKPRNMQYGEKICTTQVDWPFLNGTLRDGATVRHDDVNNTMWDGASDVENRMCHVLDRMADFSYVFVSRNVLKTSGVTTLQEGVCHTGRVQRMAPSSARCVRVKKYKTTSQLKCDDNKNWDVLRPISATPVTAYQNSRFTRKRCDACTPPPQFYTRAGSKMQPETSFGVPYRRSVERILSAELRGVICRNVSNCSALLNHSTWVKGKFLTALLSDPKSLFVDLPTSDDETESAAASLKPANGNYVTDDNLWQRPWVHCPTKESLRSGRGCNGSISKARWRADKVGSCHATIVSSLKGQPDPFAMTDVCNIDSRLTALCESIREAQSIIASANCILRGGSECSLQEFVYNPSTWETSNRAFVHQTVKEYYMRVDGCTADQPCVCGLEDEMISLRKNNSFFLRDCSAVPVMTFRDILLQMRSLIFPVCKITGTVIDLLFNLVLMMSSSAKEVATSRVVLAWAQFKQESAVITDAGSDLIFDMLFSTGVLGPWMQKNVMKACDTVNYAYNYTANVWCSLIVRKFPVFLSALRSIGGWMDVGFTVVNDIFAVILNNYIPDAMLDLYSFGYKDYFQSSKYREKQQAYDKRVKSGLVNPEQSKPLDDAMKNAERRPDNKIMQSTAQGRLGRMQKKTMKSAAQIAGVLPYVGDVAEGALMLWEISDQIDTAQQMKEALKNFPKSFTLFDFDDFYSSIDNFLDFFNRDFLCFEIDKDVMPLQCTALNFTGPSKDDVYAMAPRASTCWAEAQERDVGISNLYACTPTSTCCADPLNCDSDAGARLCSFCPVPSLNQIRQFGCNTMIQRCQCGIQSVAVDRCVAQRECGPSASCSLLTSLDDVSFGALSSCSECSTSSICLMGGNQNYGQCTCLSNADVKIDLCSESIGATVNPNPARLCGFTQDPGNIFSWSEISLVRCINTIGAICAEVMSESGNLIRMPVSRKMKVSQVAYSSRRLLSVEPETTRIQLPSVFGPDDPADDVTADVIHAMVTESAWNHTSAPCSTLAHLYSTGRVLGPVDEFTLHTCVYWRTVARQLIKENNLMALRNADTFLLSASDFASSLGQKGVLTELYQKPWVILYACMYSSWFKPVRAALIASHDPEFGATISNLTKRVWNLTKYIMNRSSSLDKQDIVETSKDVILEPISRRRGRKLMQVWDEVEQSVKVLPYYSMATQAISDGNEFENNIISASQLWNSDVFYMHFKNKSGECPVADAAVSNFKYVFAVLGLYYKHVSDMNKYRQHKSSLRDVWPSSWVKQGNYTDDVDEDDPLLYYFLQITGVKVNDVVTFLSDPCNKSDCFRHNKWTATYAVDSLLYCKFEEVMFCNNSRNDLLPSFLFICIVVFFMSIILSYIGCGGVTMILFTLIPLLTLWYSTGVSPKCLPMLPTCLLDDVIESLKLVFPMTISLPQYLVTNTTQLRKCEELQFQTWEDSLVYLYCELGFCNGMNNTLLWGVFYLRFSDMHANTLGQHQDAHRMCALITFKRVIPVIIILNILLALFFVLLATVGVIIQPIMELIWRSVIFNHSK